MRILYEIIGAGVLLGLVYLGGVQVIAIIESRKSTSKDDK